MNPNEETKKDEKPKEPEKKEKKEKVTNISEELQKELERNKTENKVLYSFETDCKVTSFVGLLVISIFEGSRIHQSESDL